MIDVVLKFLSICGVITMSVEKFLEDVNSDSGLQEELAKALEAENDREEVTKLANSKGYNFTSEELSKEIQKREKDLQKREEAGELSDEELEAVAGGVTPTVVPSIAFTFAAGMGGFVVGTQVGNKAPAKW